MSCQNCWKKLLPFGLTLTIGFFAAYVNQDTNVNRTTENIDRKVEQKDVYVFPGVKSKDSDGLTDAGAGRYTGISEDAESSERPETANVKITSKPRPAFTELARLKETQGTVTLRVTFLANGEIGKIRLIDGLPDGLSEQTIAAARKIKFEPARKDGVSYTVTRKVEYNFTLY